MAITQCANGHVYDSSIHESCPYCSDSIYRVDFGNSNDDIGRTVLLEEDVAAYAGADDTGKTVLLDEYAVSGAGQEYAGGAGYTAGDAGFNAAGVQPGMQSIAPLPPDENVPAPGRLICTQGTDAGREIVLRAGEQLRIRDGNYIFVPFWSER